MYLVVVIELSTTFLKVLDPVHACILNFWRKALLHPNASHVFGKNAGSM
jgi:hypothetical protein